MQVLIGLNAPIFIHLRVLFSNKKISFKDGNWSTWSQWTTCSLTCGGGNQSQTRNCNNPAPANGGTNCSATNLETSSRPCNTQLCPIGNE